MSELEYGDPFRIEELKSAGNGWEVAGYVSTYGNTDLGGDVVLPGAWDESLASGRKGGFLYGHDPRQVLGPALELRSDSKGLFGRFRISKTRLGEDVHQLLLDKALAAFSVGFVTQDADFSEDGFRLIKKALHVESSVVSTPMNPEAVVTAVKSAALGAPAGQTASATLDLANLKLDYAWDLILAQLAVGVKTTQDLRARRAEEQRELSDAARETITAAIAALEGRLVELREVLVAGRPPDEEQPPVGELQRRFDELRERLASKRLITVTPKE